MKPLVIYINSKDTEKFELTRDQLTAYLEAAYGEGFKDGQNSSTITTYPPIISESYRFNTITCDTTQAHTSPTANYQDIK